MAQMKWDSVNMQNRDIRARNIEESSGQRQILGVRSQTKEPEISLREKKSHAAKHPSSLRLEINTLCQKPSCPVCMRQWQ